jgi:hypothetical protein
LETKRDRGVLIKRLAFDQKSVYHKIKTRSFQNQFYTSGKKQVHQIETFRYGKTGARVLTIICSRRGIANVYQESPALRGGLRPAARLK